MARGEIHQCIDFSPNWPRNRGKINALTIEVRTLTVSAVVDHTGGTTENVEDIQSTIENQQYGDMNASTY